MSLVDGLMVLIRIDRGGSLFGERNAVSQVIRSDSPPINHGRLSACRKYPNLCTKFTAVRGFFTGLPCLHPKIGSLEGNLREKPRTAVNFVHFSGNSVQGIKRDDREIDMQQDV